MRRLAICTALAIWLVPAGVATAKKPVAAKVCGASECRTVKDHDTLMALTEGGPPAGPPRSGAPWYTVRTIIEIGPDTRDHFDSAIVPSVGLLRGRDGSGYAWMPVSAAARSVYRRVTLGLAPFPAASLKGVAVAASPREADPGTGGSSSALPWIGGGLLLVALAALLISRRGLPWPKPAQG
jgi:hypothetical protein